jgi:hypothetical protein
MWTAGLFQNNRGSHVKNDNAEAVSLNLSRPIGDGRTRLDLAARAARTLGLQSDGPRSNYPPMNQSRTI